MFADCSCELGSGFARVNGAGDGGCSDGRTRQHSRFPRYRGSPRRCRGADLPAACPPFIIVGLPDKAVAESRERVQSLYPHSVFPFPRTPDRQSGAGRLPRKAGPYDLPIALGLLAAVVVIAMMIWPAPSDRRTVAGWHERHRPLLPAAIGRHYMALAEGLSARNCGGEAAWAGGDVESFSRRASAAAHRPHQRLPVMRPPEPSLGPAEGRMPVATDSKGQDTVKRALEIAAAGGHNVLMVGPPGAGKSMLARGCLDPAADRARRVLDVIMIHAGRRARRRAAHQPRPFRAPHHSASSPLWSGAAINHPVRFRSPIMAFCFWMNFQNSGRK